MNFRCLITVAGLFLSACQPTSNGYLVRGAGSELDVTRAARSTTVLSAYLREMCVQSGYEPATSDNQLGCPNNLTTDKYKVLLIAGLSEIESGCRAYVQFLFEERFRERRFRRSSTAIQAFVNGVLTLEGAGARLFSYLVQTSTFANAFYDASHLDPLASLELRNINKIITERQTAYRRVALGTAITSRPQLVRTWRRYQWICTPQSILSDFNELTAASIEGRDVDFSADANREFVGFAPAPPLTPQTLANVDRRRPPTEVCPDCPKMFAASIASTFETRDIEIAQGRLCQASTDGKAGPRTLAALRAFDAMPGLNNDGVISNIGEWDLLLANGCSGADRATGYRSLYERQKFQNLTILVSIIVGLNSLAERSTGDAVQPGATLAATLKDPAFRELIAAARAKATGLSEPNLVDQQEYTAALDNTLP